MTPQQLENANLVLNRFAIEILAQFTGECNTLEPNDIRKFDWNTYPKTIQFLKELVNNLDNTS